MNDRSSFTQTTAEITLDLPAAVCISSALDKELDQIERSLRRAKNPETIRALENTRINTQAAKDAFDPIYRRILAAPLFTAEHEAWIARALGKEKS